MEERSPRPAGPLGGPLVPGQAIQPIDLPGALRLGGARDLDIAIARERVCQALAELRAGPGALAARASTSARTGSATTARPRSSKGQVQYDQQELAVPGRPPPRPARASPGRSPPGGPAQVDGADLDPAVLRRHLRAAGRAAGRRRPPGRRPGRDERRPARRRRGLPRPATRRGPAGHRPRGRRERRGPGDPDRLVRPDRGGARGRPSPQPRRAGPPAARTSSRPSASSRSPRPSWSAASGSTRRSWSPRSSRPRAVLRLVADGCPLDDLIATGLRNRPELAEAQALVAGDARPPEAGAAPAASSPASPSATRAAGSAAAPNGFFGNFDGRSDADVNLYWELQNLGFADRAIARQRGAQQRTARPRADEGAGPRRLRGGPGREGPARRARQMDEAGRALPEAVGSLALNLANIRRGAGLPGATRPIEVLQPDPGPRPGPGRLPRRRPRLQPGPVPPLPRPRPAAPARRRSRIW